jgi:leucyl-tRNA synthetase
MSKSDGNYMTVDETLEKYGTSATRMCLADCGDTNEDANFLESTANSMVLKLYTLTKSVEALETSGADLSQVIRTLEKISIGENNYYNKFVDDMILQHLSRNTILCLESHENMIYRDVLKYGFYENLKLIELYSGLKGNNNKIVLYLYKTILQLVYPIIPSLASYLLKLKFNNEIAIPEIFTEEDDKMKIFEHIRNVCTNINSGKKAFKNVDILVGKEFSSWKVECMRIVDSCPDKADIAHRVDEVYEKLNVTKKKAMLFCMDYFRCTEKYVIKFDEFAMLKMFIDYISDCCSMKVTISYDDRYDPLSPGFKYY